ncbi:MAG: hypothetical protein H8E85_05485 [Candidatus Marinimicrobia bacterium]|nr:hypothetical protein [Candidatus Neomarinimicrobiota bacterium]
MKKILLTVIIAFGFIQAEEWIYYNSSEGVSKVKPDGTENEVIVDDFSMMMDMSLDKSKIVSFGEHTITIVDIETMETQSVFFPEYGLSPKDIHFAYDENTIFFTDSGNELYKYSFIDSSFTLIIPDMGGSIRDLTMSPDNQKAVFLSYDYIFGEGDSIDVMIADIQSGEVSILESFPSLGNECFFGLLPGFQTYWGADDYIYFTICDGEGVQQLLKIHSSNGEPAQQVENEIRYTLSAADDSFLEKLVYVKYINDTYEYWTIDLESNETSYIDIDGEIEAYLLSQAWSPDQSKITITGWDFTGGYWGSPAGLYVYDTVTDSMITIVDYAGAWAPMFWVSGSDNGDVNGDGSLDILDIVMIVNMILAGETNNSNADYNSDGNVDILDIVAIVQVIVGN